MLVRTGVEAGGRERWLLHKHDGPAVDGWDPEEHPYSVLSGRTNQQVKADPDRMWRSDQPAARASVPLKAPAVAPPGPEELAELDAANRVGVQHGAVAARSTTLLYLVATPAAALLAVWAGVAATRLATRGKERR